jgi:hypothetical protein
MTVRINVAQDYSRTPAGRVKDDGPFSGERFREEILIPALKSSNDIVEIDLNGVLGFGSSFLDEAFGGLVRSKSFSAEELQRRIRILSDLKFYERKIWAYVQGKKG